MSAGVSGGQHEPTAHISCLEKCKIATSRDSKQCNRAIACLAVPTWSLGKLNASYSVYQSLPMQYNAQLNGIFTVLEEKGSCFVMHTNKSGIMHSHS